MRASTSAGEGTVGLITYMRTDSLRLSEEALAAARGFYHRPLRPGLLSRPAPAHLSTKEGAQDAHEAIRPSNVRLDPESMSGRPDARAVSAVQADLEPLRRLPDGRCTSMTPCRSTRAAAGHAFRASHQILKFSGFTAVYEEGRDDEARGDASASLPDLDEVRAR